LSLALCLLVHTSVAQPPPRLLVFVGNSSHIVSFEASANGQLSYLAVHANPTPSAWISTFPALILIFY